MNTRKYQKGPSNSDKEINEKGTIQEIKRTIKAVGLSCIIASIIFLFIPNIKQRLTQTDKIKIHKEFKRTKEGVLILYYKNKGTLQKTKGLSNEIVKRNLEILRRRWTKQQFNILTLPGIKNTQTYKTLLLHAKNYQFNNIIEENGYFLLKIRTKGLRSTKALHDYIKYLEEYWI